MKIKRPYLWLPVVVATTCIAATQNNAEAQKDNLNCSSQISRHPGNYNYLGECIPYPLWINSEYGLEYGRLMRLAIRAAANQEDYDTAIINFYRAQEISGPKDKEVRRGLFGAITAKGLKEFPVEGYSHVRMWILITGEYSTADFDKRDIKK